MTVFGMNPVEIFLTVAGVFVGLYILVRFCLIPIK